MRKIISRQDAKNAKKEFKTWRFCRYSGSLSAYAWRRGTTPQVGRHHVHRPG